MSRTPSDEKSTRKSTHIDSLLVIHLAGLGIGGITIALATQKTIEHFIGAVTLYLSAPVKVGDFCRFGDNIGTVEEIGLRSTQVRTLEQTVISVPTGDFAGMPLENFAERQRFRFAPRIRLRVDTSADQIRFVLLELQKLLHATIPYPDDRT